MTRYIRRLRLAKTRGDEGAALVITLMMLAILGALTLTLAVITTTNLQSARASQQAGVAVNASDAGISQAITYLRTSGVRDINSCSPNCTTNPWGNKTSPMTVTVAGKNAQTYSVWIEPIAPYPANKPGLYRVHSSGIAGGPAGRKADIDVSLDSYDIPLGIMANSINGGGDAGVTRESLFSTGCIYGREKIQIEGTDAAYGEPAGVHTSQIITESQGSGQFCPGTQKPIHDTRNATKPCNLKYRYDQDNNGGPLAGTLCQGSNGAYPQTSYIKDAADLFSKYKLQQPTLTQSQIDNLRTISLAQNNYWTKATGWAQPDERNAVMFFDLTEDDPGGLVDLNDITNFGRPADLGDNDARCTSTSLVIVIVGGNARLNSNQELSASVFLTSTAPYGKVTKANGTAQFVGTLYADNIDLTGTSNLSLDKCFLANLSPALFTAQTFNYREVDRD